MSRYTSYLFEYLNDGFTLPEIFGEVPAVNGKTFAELFTAFYKWHELGFSTEWRFHDELEALANLIVPDYVRRMKLVEKLNAELGTDDTEERTTYAAPAGLTTGNNEQAREKITRSETSNELLAELDHLNDDSRNLYVQLMIAFRTCFLGVF